jgi:hypothetical protein
MSTRSILTFMAKPSKNTRKHKLLDPGVEGTACFLNASKYLPVNPA